MENYDDWHYSFAEIDGYDAPVNFVLSPRGTGKTTAFWRKSWAAFQKTGARTIVQTRQQNDITDIFIESIHFEIDKFSKVPPFKYSKKEINKDGMCDIYVDGKKYLRILAMSTPLKKLKGLFLNNVAFWWADEYVCNERIGEKYVKGEAYKFREAWTTFFRENKSMKAYLCGNPYSAYNPYFSEFGIDPAAVEIGKIIAGGNKKKGERYLWAVERYKPNERLLEELKKNPMTKLEDDYTDYALNGLSVNDKNVYLMAERPANFALLFFFKIEGKLLAVWENQDYGKEPRYWVGFESEAGKRRDVYCFDFQDLSERVVIFSRDEKNEFGHFRMAVRNREVAFSNIECNHYIKEIYPTL